MEKKIRISFIEIGLLLIILIIASVCRLLWLDKIPNAISGDELVYLLTAKAIFLTGKDMAGIWSPLSIFAFYYPPNQIQAELPYFLVLPLVGLAKFSLLSARLTFAFISILSVLIIYLIVKEMFGKKVGFIAGLIASINPWLIYIGRTNYEVNPSMFFYLLVFYIILRAKKWKIIYALPFLTFAFYSDIATKVIIVPFTFICCWYGYFVINKRKFLKQYLVLFIFSIIMVIFLLVSLKLHPASSRLSDLLGFNNPEIERQVNDIRKVSIQVPFTNLAVNKFTVFSKIEITKFFNIFSPNYLFISGDAFASWVSGLFYCVDALFLLFGIICMFAYKRKIFYLFSALIFISIFPHLVHRTLFENFTPHVYLMVPFLIFFIAYGIDQVIALGNKNYFKIVISLLIGIVYLLELFYFLNIYFFQFPLWGYFDFSVRTLSQYVSLAKNQEKEIVIYTSPTGDKFNKYLFYSNSYNDKTSLIIKNLIKSKSFELGNVKFLSCNGDIDVTKLKTLTIYDVSCGSFSKQNNNRLMISRLMDGGPDYYIYNDHLCGKFSLKGYPSNLSINDFAIEQLSSKKFCETFIAR